MELPLAVAYRRQRPSKIIVKSARVYSGKRIVHDLPEIGDRSEFSNSRKLSLKSIELDLDRAVARIQDSDDIDVVELQLEVTYPDGTVKRPTMVFEKVKEDVETI